MRKLVILSIVVAVIGGVATNTAQARSKGVYTGDFITATNIVGRYYGHSVEKWLVDCSSSEGGHGGWVWHNHVAPSKKDMNWPGGWMQFMESTWNSNFTWAYHDALRRGLRIHPKARSYYEPLGQAVVAAAMFKRYGSGPWTGYRC